MEGVDILSQEIIYNTILPAGFMLLSLITTAIFLGLVAYGVSIENKVLFIIGIMSMIICFCGSIILGTTPNKNDINYIEYKVTIDDSVSFTEFNTKYEILDQEGKIYIVKERE